MKYLKGGREKESLLCESHGSMATVWYPAHTRTSEEMCGIIMYHL